MNPEKIAQLKEQDRSLIWHPFTQMQDYQAMDPLIVERAQGVYLYDLEGKAYIDGISSLWVNVHGHQKEAVDQAIQDQLKKVAHSTLLGIGNVPSIKLAQALLKIAPSNLARVFYSDSGSTSVEVALKMAFQYWQSLGKKQKTKFICLENAYHGDTLGSVSVGGMELFHEIFRPLLFETILIKDFSFKQAKVLFEKHAFETAACIVEPLIQGAAGMRLMPEGFLSHLRELCDQHGVLLICDEVATGFGRTGKMFAVEHEKVKPDLLCLAKGISAGYLPLAATLATEEIFQAFLGRHEEFKTFFHGHSYTGNPLACAAALANLKIFEEEKVLEALTEKIQVLEQGLQDFLKHPHIKEVRQKGLMAGLELIKDKKTGEAFLASEQMGAKVCYAARRHGALLRPLGDVLVLMPPLGISTETLKELLNILWKALEETLPS
ncbi:MAG: adenosylmethionine--8-amino-7-oxononanoate transaminase [Deltaproteobacteria bacterium]|nr:adenosylmethionine--8-amino-7-oxononanoate transaminase [Deltaproteobacteria bacterium]